MDDEITRSFKNGHYQRASHLLQKVRDPNNIGLLYFYPEKHKHIDCKKYNVSLLHLAAYHGWLDICDQLITKYNHDPRVQEKCQSLIDHSKQFKEYSGFLLDISQPQWKTNATISPDVPPTPPPLFYATLSGHYDVVTYLINKCDCDPHQQSIEGETLLYLACLVGHYEIVTYLISKCHCNPNTTIKLMVPVSRAEMQKSFMPPASSYYAWLNIIDHILYTPLHTACRYGHLNIVKFIVSVSSVDVNRKASDGYTPLHTACHHGQLESAKILLSSSLVDINIKNNDGDTSLHIACQYGELQIVQLLMSTTQINPMSTNAKHDTALHIACSYSNVDIVKYLLSTGLIDPIAMNRYQDTPVQLAGNNYAILKLFEPCRVDFPVESYSKVFLCGNTTNGKSSLAHALGQRVKMVSMHGVARVAKSL